MYSRTSTLLSRSCRYFLRTPVHQSYSPFSVSARSFAAVNAAMADATQGVTADLIKAKLTDQLQAQHVEIEDLSGKSRCFSRVGYRLEGDKMGLVMANVGWLYRWLRTGVPGRDRFPPVREEDHARPPPVGQRGFEGGDCRHPRLDAQMLYPRAVAGAAAVNISMGRRKEKTVNRLAL